MKSIFQSPTLSISSTLSSNSSLQKKLGPNGRLFLRMKDKVLGKKYELSIVFVGKKFGRTLNKKHRGKDYATDILSFELDKNEGEIFLQPDVLARKAKEFDRKPENYLNYLVIHGLFHLKGMAHGSKMDTEEARVRNFFKI